MSVMDVLTFILAYTLVFVLIFTPVFIMVDKAFPFKQMEPFSAGDKVTAFGNVGVVKKISVNGMYLEVLFPEFDSVVLFERNGKYTNWHKKPSLRKL